MRNDDSSDELPMAARGLQSALRPVRPLRKLGLWLLGATAIYGGALAVTLPAEAVKEFWVAQLAPVEQTVVTRALDDRVRSVSGTLWAGRADLMSGHRLSWHFKPWQLAPRPHLTSERAVAIEAQLRLSGSDGTALAGRLRLTRHRMAVHSLAGSLNGTAFDLIDPVKPLGCEMRIRVSLDHAAFGLDLTHLSASGEIESGPIRCQSLPADGTRASALALPALHVGLQPTPTGFDATATRVEDRDTELAVIRLSAPGRDRPSAPGRAKMTLYPAGAALIPGAPTSRASTIETEWP